MSDQDDRRMWRRFEGEVEAIRDVTMDVNIKGKHASSFADLEHHLSASLGYIVHLQGKSEPSTQHSIRTCSGCGIEMAVVLHRVREFQCPSCETP